MSRFTSDRDPGLGEILELEDYLLLVTVVGLPWAFGGVQIWAFRSAALLIICAAAVVIFRDGMAGLGLRRRSGWLLPALLLVLWGAFQLVPLPAGVVGLLSPGADQIYRRSFPDYPGRPQATTQLALEQQALVLVPEAAGLPTPERDEPPMVMETGGRWSGRRGIALVPEAGLERVFWYLALLIAFVVVRVRCRDPEIASAYRKVLFGLFFALAVFGLIYAATSNGKLYWVRATLGAARPFGPYVNPTNFGGVMELAIPWLAGYTLFAWNTRSRTTPLRETRIPFLLAATVVCVLAALATASKAAALLTLVSVAVLLLFAVRRWRQRLIVLASVLVLGAGVAALLRFVPLGDRMRDFLEASGGSVSQVDRVVTWRASLEMMRDYALTGVGFGSFGDVFPAYLPAGEFRRWYHVHNDYLELALEGGVVAVVLVAWLIFAYWRRLIAAIGRAARPEMAFIGLVLGILALSVHALFDFNHQIPANGLLFTTMAAIAVSIAESKGQSGA
jgi:O-antigen ligase